MDEQRLTAALALYPERGWDADLDLDSVPESTVLRVVQALLDEHERFPLAIDDYAAYTGYFVIKDEQGYLGYQNTSLPADDDDQAPELALSVEELADGEHAAEVLVASHFRAPH